MATTTDPRGAPSVANKPQKYTPRGTSSLFNDKKYDISNYSYPLDLMSNTYGNNYVIFYINVSTDSKLIKEDKVSTVELDPNEIRDQGDTVAKNLDTTQLVAANAATNTVKGILGGSIIGGKGGAVAGAAIANIPTVGVGVAASMAPMTQNRGQKRLKTAIALHIPNQLNIRYGMQWSDEETSEFAMGEAGTGEIIKALSGKGSLKDTTDVGQAVLTNLALGKGPNNAANSAVTGLAANPKKEQIFKGVDFRTFQFDYQFFPRSAPEAQHVLNIIEQFKYHMHPEFKDTSNFVYIYPSEFDIFYYQGNQENLNLHRHTSCVLTEMNINYTPNGTFSTFQNGMPTQINITLAFKELALLTKDKIKDNL
jgi:hypothetical protein